MSYALVLREASDGILRTLEWCYTAAKVDLVNANQDLIHLVASAFAFLMTVTPFSFDKLLLPCMVGMYHNVLLLIYTAEK